MKRVREKRDIYWSCSEMTDEAGERRPERWGSDCDGDGGKAMYLPAPEEDIIDHSLSLSEMALGERVCVVGMCVFERERERFVSEWGFVVLKMDAWVYSFYAWNIFTTSISMFNLYTPSV